MTGFWENEGGVGYPMMEKAYGGAMTSDAVAVAPQMPVGENTVKSTVSITYEVK